MSKLEVIIVRLNRTLVGGLLAAVFAIVTMNVVGRYGFGHSFAWVEELARHLMILGAFAGAGLALREGRLVAITTLPDVLPDGLRRALKWAMVVVMFVFMAAMLWLGIEFVRFGWDKETMSTGMSRGVPYLSIPVGCALFLIHLFFFARRFVSDDFEDGAADPKPGEGI